MMKLCTHTNSILHISVIEQLRILKANDFESVMLFWYPDLFDTPPSQYVEEAKALGLRIENIHIPFFDSQVLWQESEAAQAAEQLIIRTLEECRHHKIHKAVLHPSGWRQVTEINPVGLERFKRLVDEAEKRDIILALENISDVKVLDFLFDNIKSDYLKFCYDNGHENIFSKDAGLLLKYKDRLAGLHLTDNHGIDDDHLLPFDGNFDWKNFNKTIKDISYQGPLSFEVSWQLDDSNKKYTDDNYIKELKKRAEKILGL